MKAFETYKALSCRLVLLLLLLFATMAAGAATYPAYCRVTTTLNVRSGPGPGYSKIGQLYTNNEIIVKSVTQNGSMQWGTIDYYGRTGYVAVRYVSYIRAVQETPAPAPQYSQQSSSSSSFFSNVWSFIKTILIVIFVLLCIAYWEKILEFLLTLGFFAGIGAIISKLVFDDYSSGAIVGVIIALLLKLRLILEALSSDNIPIFGLIYGLLSFPIWFLNRLQFILMEPWRYFTKENIDYEFRDFVRPILYPVELILYVAITPLRLINAILYNQFVYGITELYDLFMETLQPSKEEEGSDDLWTWIIWFPVRLVKYPIFRGFLVLTEGAIWTVIDVFIPTITMYHGTDLTAAQSIVGNEWGKGDFKNWTDGTFCSSKYGWAGAGAYFGSARSTARTYAFDSSRLSDNNPVMIVCRVSLGKILNYGLAPKEVSNNTGPYGHHSQINKYAESNGYTTGEWWNAAHNYWEFCMFDWQYAYNNPWRIRPIYVFNFRTGLAQHIQGGFRHWLFSEMVLTDILRNPWFMGLVGFAILVVLWFVFYGWEELWDTYLWWYFF